MGHTGRWQTTGRPLTLDIFTGIKAGMNFFVIPTDITLN